MEAFLSVEVPGRVLLRLTDGHAPNLGDVSFFYDTYKKESIEAASTISAQHPDIYQIDLPTQVARFWESRKTDIVTPLVLAASMVNPVLIYGDGPDYNPEGGSGAIRSMIMSYYSLNADHCSQALLVYLAFREKSGVFFNDQDGTAMQAAKISGDAFWTRAGFFLDNPVGCELFRKLMNGYAGQGESERLNKKVKQYRSILRNRQAHATTSAYLQLQSYYAGLCRKKESPKSPLEFIREKTLAAEALKELEDIQALENEVLIEIGGEGIIVSDILEDAETPLDPPDEEYNGDEGGDPLLEELFLYSQGGYNLRFTLSSQRPVVNPIGRN